MISIYVSHNSEQYINKFAVRHKDELGDKVFLINSSINNYVSVDELPLKVVNIGKNIGFAAANNIGIEYARKYNPDYFLIVNPDVYLPKGWLESILSEIEQKSLHDSGIITVPLLSYDFGRDRESEIIDSFGIAKRWYGRWYDIAQGVSKTDMDWPDEPYEIEAACGALMLINIDVVSALMKKDGYIFEESYFMYKEDIELSLKVKSIGKKIIMLPTHAAYHCRGWKKGRQNVPYWARKLSAKNELRLHYHYFWKYLPYSLLKYFYVIFIEKVIDFFKKITSALCF